MLVTQFFWLVLFTSCLFTITGFVGKDIWFLDLTSHFPLQYLAIQVVALFITINIKHRSPLFTQLVLLIAISINLFNVGDYYSAVSPDRARQAVVQHVRILQMNVLYSNHNYRAVNHLLESTNADIISLQEMNRGWLHKLKQGHGLSKFRYQLVSLSSGNILASKYPLLNPRILSVSDGRSKTVDDGPKGAVLVSDIKIGLSKITLISLHPPIPLSSSYEAGYRQYFKTLEENKANFQKNMILIGDLNTTPWSGHYRNFLEILDLKDARAHQGFYPTWNCYLPLFAIPIDHIMATRHFVPLQQRVGPFIGSDHLPVYLELGLKQ